MSLKTPFEKPVAPTPDLAGDLATQRGSDPNADGNPGPGGIKDFWPGRVLAESASPGMSESANSVSGLPSLPSRFAPAESAVQPPTLQDRNPGTIDRK